MFNNCSPPSRSSGLHWRGLFVPGEGDRLGKARVVVFIDYQNVYRGARECFGLDNDPHTQGQVSPLGLAQLITASGLSDRALHQVRVYRGIPDSKRDPKGYGAARRQTSSWATHPLVEVITRPLRYPFDYPASPAEEKGIDVSLAVDFVVMGVRSEYEVGVLMSTDTDLKPALEALADLAGDPFPRAEVAAWAGEHARRRRLAVKQRNIWCHWLNEQHFRSVADPRDYNIVTKATGQ